MNCCHAQTERIPRRRWWRSAGACVGSGTLLLVLPKCPLCIAAYLAIWAGSSLALPFAMHLRTVLEIAFTASAILLLLRSAAMRSGAKKLALNQHGPTDTPLLLIAPKDDSYYRQLR